MQPISLKISCNDQDFIDSMLDAQMQIYKALKVPKSYMKPLFKMVSIKIKNKRFARPVIIYNKQLKT